MITHYREGIVAAAKEAGAYISGHVPRWIEHLYDIAHEDGRVSRDAEITELKVVSDHNLATYHQAAELLRAEIATLKGMVVEIQAARHVQKEHNDLLVKNHKLREQVDLYEQALAASWPDGASGNAFDFWNAARKLAATEPNW